MVTMLKLANLARLDYKNALHLFPKNDNNWIPKVETVSALEKHGIDKIVQILSDFETHTKSNGYFSQKRNQQQKYWMHESLKEMVLNHTYSNPAFNILVKQLEDQILNGEISSFKAAEKLYQHLYNHDES